MLDINFIRNHQQDLSLIANQKGINISIERIIQLDFERRKLIHDIELARFTKKKLSNDMKDFVLKGDNQHLIKSIKLQIDEINKSLKANQQNLESILNEYNTLMLLVPNIISSDTPIGLSDKDNVVVKECGRKPTFTFSIKDHIELGHSLDIIDIKRGVKVAGTRNYYLKNMGASLHRAVQQLAIDHLIQKGFTLLEVPAMVNEEMFINTGFFPIGQDQTYKLANSNKYLIGTSEVPIVSYYSNEFVNIEKPIKLAGISNCFRSEVGAAGRDVKGLYRVHQFSKVEQVILCENNVEKSNLILEEITQNAEEILQLLELPYRVVSVCTGDIGQGVFKKYDIETWMPSRNSYGETQSASNLLDFQSRRSKIRYKDNNGEIKYCHTLNNTAIATPRILIPLLEVHQQEDGSIYIPRALRKYLNNQEYIESR
ncbi:serine--tRNA ligase [Bacillus paranthracis]|uniref:Serine--tRNA ligase n=4 Tax=Bacillus cereus group TaxID=86661 RepID=A0A5M9GRL8_9BACI|nr:MULTISPECIES: serine--tRNA ligase [Bacillus]ACJ79139.1 seryl-tRNA synthetase [Bacillus cereus AH187]ACM10872.1 SerS [Bacillus cereus Q1]EDZ58915.1 seryl-tRNA synthetase [Bacillus cereus H3081.97]EEK97053.1 Seryl-tRNA synthetase [Bacillus cereus BDRD-ST26]EJP85485.1 serine-tRNA ligase [Bacillus cereus IS075]EJP99333.1 serine-tRNA ligase [Bacillus cereus AND1407]EJR04455.1 serine-tRNA ligase [Bacillus cereus MSX-A12]EOO90996.1 serine-tRNA ligase [Bacillus cereus IS845/00]EOO97571.1 serine